MLAARIIPHIALEIGNYADKIGQGTIVPTQSKIESSNEEGGSPSRFASITASTQTKGQSRPPKKVEELNPIYHEQSVSLPPESVTNLTPPERYSVSLLRS